MPRKNLNVDVGIEGNQGKVRKRRISSSSPSSLVRNHRSKRVISVGKRGGLSSIPVPIWRVTSKSPSFLNEKSVALDLKSFDNKGHQELSVSARKLAANLWEINGVVSPKHQDNLDGKKVVRKDRILRESHLEPMEMNLFDVVKSSNDVSYQAMDRRDLNAHRRRNSVGSQKNLHYSLNVEGSNSIKNATLIEVLENRRRPNGSRDKNRLNELVAALTTSKELLKVLSRISCVEEQQPTNISLLSAIKTELDRACIHVNKLIHDRNSNEQLIDHLLIQFELEKANWKIKEKERIQSAIRSMSEDYEAEKKLKRQTERLNQKLGKELAETKAKLGKVTEELEREIRANNVLQKVCNELDTKMGKDREKVEEIIRESAKIRAEVEKEREMLQLADLLREERVQMKLLEAKYEFEEKNAVVDNLKTELEAYLSTRVDEEEETNGSPNYERIKELENYLKKTLPIPPQYQDDKKDDGKEEEEEDDDDDDDDSVGSDVVHSVELNVDGIVQNGSKVDTISRKSSVFEEGLRQRICYGRPTYEDIEWEFSPKRKGSVNAFDGKGSFEIFSSDSWKKESEDEIERYNMIKDLRDHIVSGSKMTPSKQVCMQI